jgi:hypothetical protein
MSLDNDRASLGLPFLLAERRKPSGVFPHPLIRKHHTTHESQGKAKKSDGSRRAAKIQISTSLPAERRKPSGSSS